MLSSTGLHSQLDKHTSVPAINSNSHVSKPSRISSEPPSKISASSVLYTQHNGQEHEMHKQFVLSSSANKLSHDICTISTSAHSNSNSVCTCSENCSNSSPNNAQVTLLGRTLPEELLAQGNSVVIYKLDIGPRIKSASSHKSHFTLPAESVKDSETSATSTELSLNVVPCALNQLVASKPPKIVQKMHKKTDFNPSHSNDGADDKLSVLASIYGKVYETADKVAAQIEGQKKVKKIFLSDKQSGTIKENGMEFPCAPPATPTPGIYMCMCYIDKTVLPV